MVSHETELPDHVPVAFIRATDVLGFAAVVLDLYFGPNLTLRYF